MNDTLCWDCVNCRGGCSWMRGLKPVKGWTAKPTTVDGNSSYLVMKCPLFKMRDNVPKVYTVKQICDMIGLYERTYYRWTKEEVIALARQKGCSIEFNYEINKWVEVEE